MNEKQQPDHTPKGLLLVADDFAFTAGTSRAILDLIAKGRLSATGAMTNRPEWPVFAPALADLGANSDAGLHLNLTVGTPLGPMPALAPTGEFPSVGTIIKRGVSGGLDHAELVAEITRQIEAFAHHYGALPAFIDGHQHVHALPGVRRALLASLNAFGPDYQPFLRDPADTPGSIVARGVATQKALVIAGLATGFGRGVRARGYRTNHGFSGVSPFDPARDFGTDFVRFLHAPGDHHMVMVHPGEANDADLARLDPVIATRVQEWDFLRGEQMPELLSEAGFALDRVNPSRAAEE